MENTVESRMMKMLKHKYGDNPESDEENDDSADDGDGLLDAAAAAKANNTFVGSVNADKATVLAAEFDLLFGYDHREGQGAATAEAAIPDAALSFAQATPGVVGHDHQELLGGQDDTVPDAILSFPLSGRGSRQSGDRSGFL